jgi:hypothetical protein
LQATIVGLSVRVRLLRGAGTAGKIRREGRHVKRHVSMTTGDRTGVSRLLTAFLCAVALSAAAPAAATKVAFVGGVKAMISGGTVVLFAAGIQNNSAHGTGTLRMELWAASQPYGGGTTPGEFKLAQFRLGILPAGAQYVNVSSPSLQLGTPPDGTWYYTLFLTEFTGGVGDDGFTANDWRLQGTVTIGSPPPPTPPSPPIAVAVEYYNALWGFYFLTAFPEEIAALDAGAFGGVWQRTGETFNVWPQPIAGSLPTCRFFSAVFAPRSTHFYTPYPQECGALKASPAWSYEGIAFYVQPTNAVGLCPAGTIALFRLYNDSMGGAPNHRFTISVATLNDMIAAHWVFEGNGATKAFACVPQ